MEIEIDMRDWRVYHYSFEIYGMLGMFIIHHNFFGQLRNVVSRIALACDIDFSLLVTGETIQPS